jgi:pre-rRNA-processing protein TSR2
VLVDEFPPMPAHLAALASHASKADPDAAADDVPDEEYVETMLQQVMQDEFEVTVEDGSAGEVAAAIIRLWTRCLAGDLAEAEAVVRRWQGTKGKAAPEGLFTRGADPDQEVEGDDWEDDEDDDDDDDEMGEAPALVEAPKEKPPPEVDEDGFTKVTRRKR